jgi:hypothetical protein
MNTEEQVEENLRMVPDPAKRPFGRCPSDIGSVPDLFDLSRHVGGQKTSPKRLHDDHAKALGSCIEKPRLAGLRVFIHVVVLDLAEIPRVVVHNILEIVPVAVVRKADPSDFSFGFQFLKKFFHTEAF